MTKQTPRGLLDFSVETTAEASRGLLDPDQHKRYGDSFVYQLPDEVPDLTGLDDHTQPEGLRDD